MDLFALSNVFFENKTLQKSINIKQKKSNDF